MSNKAAAIETMVLLEGLALVESRRWHDDRFWFAHWGTGEIRAVDLYGRSEVTGHGPDGLGWTIDWLPDGRLLVSGKELVAVQKDGTTAPYADLRSFGVQGWNDLVVDGRGNVYVTSIAFGFLAGETATTGMIVLVTPDGVGRQVAGDLELPNGMVVTPDNSMLIISESFAGRLTAFDINTDGSLANRRVWADGLAPDAICLDAEGAIWVGTPSAGDGGTLRGAVVRIREGGGPESRRPRPADLRVRTGRPRPADPVSARGRVAGRRTGGECGCRTHRPSTHRPGADTRGRVALISSPRPITSTTACWAAGCTPISATATSMRPIRACANVCARRGLGSARNARAVGAAQLRLRPLRPPEAPRPPSSLLRSVQHARVASQRPSRPPPDRCMATQPARGPTSAQPSNHKQVI